LANHVFEKGQFVTKSGSRRQSKLPQLNASDWIEAGLDVLAEHGIDAVRVEPICRRLGVTKGSFYHHFQDRPALLSEMLQRWRRRATLEVIERIEQIAGTPEEKLKQLIMMPHSGRTPGRGARVDFAIRLWSRNDPQVAIVIDEVDEARMAYIAGLLRDAALPSSEIEARSTVIYAFMLGEAMIAPTQLASATSRTAILISAVLRSV
jgi:AcrR family transcriptional regulator